MKQVIEEVKRAKREGGRVYICGNGGSFANAMHIANDLISCGVRAHTLDPSTLTAMANDFGYEHVFARWLEVFAEKGDILIALSGSGTSKNIVSACLRAGEIGMTYFLITDYLRTKDMQQSEEEQVHLGHEIMRELKCER